MASLNREIRAPVNFDELWIKTETQQDATDLINQYSDLVQARQLDEERKTIKAEPLLLGLRSVTYLSYLLTAILSLVGFATYFYLSARKREVAYGVLRSLGLSPIQLYGSLLLEQAVMILSGLTLGTILGLLLNNLVLPGLPVTSGGLPPIPAFLVYEDWYAVIRLYSFLMGSFLAVLGGVTALLWRSKLHSILRIGQE
jgi:ABC-type antimicrobial peptide transport system permease subunit